MADTATMSNRAGQFPNPAQSRSRRIDLLIAVGLAAVTLAVFWPVRHFGFIDFDDPQYVPLNPHVLNGLNWSDVRWALTARSFLYWHPLTWLSYQLDVSLWGPNPGPMHLENAVMHAVSAGLWFLAWNAMTGRRGRSLVVAALFAVHPTRVESVAWIAERKDVLSTLLMTVSLLAYVRYTGGGRAMVWYFASLLVYGLSITAKPMTMTFPILLLLLDGWPMGRLKGFSAPEASGKQISIRRAVVEKLPFAGLGSVAVVMTLASSGQSASLSGGAIARLSIYSRVSTAVLAYPRYLGHLIAPIRLSIFYPYVPRPPLGMVVAAAGIFAVISWVCWKLRHTRPHLAFGWVWFVVAMLPVIGLVQSGRQSMADRFTYVAAIGPFVAVVWLVADAVYRRGKLPQATASAVAAGVICLFAVVTIRFLPAWRDGVSIFTYSAESVGEPDDTIENHLDAAYAQTGRPDLALDHFALEQSLVPDDPGASTDVGVLLLQADPARALPFLKFAAEHSPADPLTQLNYGLALEKTQQPQAAAAAFERVLQLEPGNAPAAAGLRRLEKQ